MPGKNGWCSCWTTWPWFWVLQRVAVARQTSTTLVAKFVSSLLPRSPSVSADGLRQKIIRPTSHLVQSVTDRACIPMLTNVGPSATGSALDSELLAVLSAEVARIAGEEAQARKTVERSLLRWCRRPKSRRRSWHASLPSSASPLSLE